MRFVSLTVGLVLAAVTGCSLAAGDGGQGNPVGPVDEVPAGQQWALGDGVVSAAEYRTAVERFRACVQAGGYQVGTPVTSPIDGLSLVYDITPSGEPQRY